MTFTQKLSTQFSSPNHSVLLCIGLDTVWEQIPLHLRTQSAEVDIAEFNRRIIDATQDICAAYKLNLAFYEQYGMAGMAAFEETLRRVPSSHIVIADAKRGDIGNTSLAYARTFFEHYNCDAITVSPYMGSDSVKPFLEYPDKMTFVLALTSNQGSADFQHLVVQTQKGTMPLYHHVVQTVLSWTPHNNIGFVVGATHPQELADIREIAPESVLLIPGIGTQGGDAQATVSANGSAPALVNVSRAVLYAESSEHFAEAARAAAESFAAQLRSNIQE